MRPSRVAARAAGSSKSANLACRATAGRATRGTLPALSGPQRRRRFGRQYHQPPRRRKRILPHPRWRPGRREPVFTQLERATGGGGRARAAGGYVQVRLQSVLPIPSVAASTRPLARPRRVSRVGAGTSSMRRTRVDPISLFTEEAVSSKRECSAVTCQWRWRDHARPVRQAARAVLSCSRASAEPSCDQKPSTRYIWSRPQRNRQRIVRGRPERVPPVGSAWAAYCFKATANSPCFIARPLRPAMMGVRESEVESRSPGFDAPSFPSVVQFRRNPACAAGNSPRSWSRTAGCGCHKASSLCHSAALVQGHEGHAGVVIALQPLGRRRELAASPMDKSVPVFRLAALEDHVPVVGMAASPGPDARS